MSVADGQTALLVPLQVAPEKAWKKILYWPGCVGRIGGPAVRPLADCSGALPALVLLIPFVAQPVVCTPDVVVAVVIHHLMDASVVAGVPVLLTLTRDGLKVLVVVPLGEQGAPVEKAQVPDGQLNPPMSADPGGPVAELG